MVVDLTLTSSVAGAPLNRVVILEYTEDLFLSNPHRKINLGYTDTNGKMYIEEKIHRKAKSLKLKILYHYNMPENYILVEGLSKTKKNTIVVEL